MPDNDKSTEMLLEELNELRGNEYKFRTIAQTAVDAIILADVLRKNISMTMPEQ